MYAIRSYYAIVYDDNDVIVFDKPAFMPVHPSHKHLDDTLGNFFASHCEGLTFRPINRLDRDTSGLCVAAKNRFSRITSYNVCYTKLLRTCK